MVKISIIIPVYNSSKYLSACLESVLSQTYENIEVILIEDGSEDDSLQICNLYAKKDPRIHVILKNHGGPGAARNLGIHSATGEYIIFVDSDDICEPDLINKLLINVPQEPASLVLCGIRLIDESGVSFGEFLENYWVLNIRSYISNILSVKKTNPFCGGVYSKLYRRSILISNYISFEEDTTYAEDFCFNLKYLRYVKKVIVLPDLLYNYRYRRRGSLTANNLLNSEFSALWRRRLSVIKQYKALFSFYEIKQARAAEIAAFCALQKLDMIEISIRRVQDYSTFKANMLVLQKVPDDTLNVPADRMPGIHAKDLLALYFLNQNHLWVLYQYELIRKFFRRLRGRERWGA